LKASLKMWFNNEFGLVMLQIHNFNEDKSCFVGMGSEAGVFSILDLRGPTEIFKSSKKSIVRNSF
jgi:hypothetical protein